ANGTPIPESGRRATPTNNGRAASAHRRGNRRSPYSFDPKTSVLSFSSARKPAGTAWLKSSGTVSSLPRPRLRTFNATNDSSIQSDRPVAYSRSRNPSPTRTSTHRTRDPRRPRTRAAASGRRADGAASEPTTVDDSATDLPPRSPRVYRAAHSKRFALATTCSQMARYQL